MRSARSGERGSALIIASVVVLLMAGMAGSFFILTLYQNKAGSESYARENALPVAEAGLDDAVFRMNTWVVSSPALATLTGSVGGGAYSVTITPPYNGGTGAHVLRSTGTIRDGRRSIEILVTPNIIPIFDYAAFGERGIWMDSNSTADSYNSSMGTYASQYSGATGYAGSNGDIGSNVNITGSGNYLVRGDVAAGGTTDMVASHVSGSINGGVTPEVLPPIVVPPAVLALPATPKTLTGSTTQTLPAGMYHWSNLNLDSNAQLTVQGPATIVVDGNSLTQSNAKFLVDSTNGPVDVYFRGGVQWSANVDTRPLNYRPGDLRIWITTDNYTANPSSWDPTPQVKVDSNAEVYAQIYAPNATMNLNSNGQIYGSVVAKKLKMDSNMAVHYDESLAGTGIAGPYRSRGWKEFVPR